MCFTPVQGKEGGLVLLKTGNAHEMSSFVLSGLPRGLPWAALLVTTQKAAFRNPKLLQSRFCNTFATAACCFTKEGSGPFLHEFFSCYPSSSHLPFAREEPDPLSTSFLAAAPVPAMPSRGQTLQLLGSFFQRFSSIEAFWTKIGFFTGFALSLSPLVVV